MVEAKKTFYYICVHPIACWFDNIVFNTLKRVFVSMILAFILTMLSQVYPVCTENFCYSIFAQIFFNPAIFLKSFAYSLIIVPAFYTFGLLTFVWFGVLSAFSVIQKTGKINEMFLPVLSAIFFVYLAFLVSGTLGSLFLHTGLVECISNDDCIRAGYVGEVCTSVYHPVYTKYSPDLKPLEKCSCIANKCTGS
jgi:hypothetical protein